MEYFVRSHFPQMHTSLYLSFPRILWFSELRMLQKITQQLPCLNLQLKVYTASNVKEELEAAKRDFLQANIVVKKSKKVFLPKVLERFAREASISSDELPKWVSDNVDGKLQESIQKCMEHRTGKKTSQIIEWLPYSSRFRYVFSTNLTERPWWS